MIEAKYTLTGEVNVATQYIVPNLEEGKVTPTKEEQVIMPNESYNGFSKVTVDPIPNEYIIPTGNLDIKANGDYDVTENASVNVNVQPNLQEKEAKITAPTNIFVHPDENYDGLSFVNVIASVDTETKEVTPSKEAQTITRSDDKYIESVTVNAIPDNYIEPSGELEITENGSYDVTDKASVKVSTSGADLSEYIGGEIKGTSSSSSTLPWTYAIKKLGNITITGNTTQYLFSKFLGQSLDLSNFDTSQVTNMSYMFNRCKNLLELDLSNFDTNKVTNMSYMFNYCENLLELDLSNFDTSQVTDMSYMFVSCSNLTSLDLSNFDTSQVTDMRSMFNSMLNLNTLNVSNFDTSQVTTMEVMFYQCNQLTMLDLSDFDMKNVTNISRAFSLTSKLKNLTFGINLGKGYTQKSSNYSNYKLDLSNCKSLTHDSLMSVINNLYDLNLTYDVANGGTLYTQSLGLGADNIAKLTEEELAVATNKGWTVS